MTAGDARRLNGIEHAAATRRPFPSRGTAVRGFLAPLFFRKAAGRVPHVGGRMDLDPGLVPGLDPPLLRAVTGRTADLATAAIGLAAGPGPIGSLQPARLAELASLVRTQPQAVV